jgi:hypothetical protein
MHPLDKLKPAGRAGDEVQVEIAPPEAVGDWFVIAVPRVKV